MKILECRSAAEGLAIGKAFIIEQEQFHIPKKKIIDHEIEEELNRFKDCTGKFIADIDALISDLEHSKENKDILETHKMILTDPEFEDKVTKFIKEDLYSLEHAVNEHFKEVVNFFQGMENEYYAMRSSDYKDVASGLLRRLLKREDNRIKDVNKDSILILHSVTPSFVIKIFQKKVAGIIVEKGSVNSHSAIMARSLSIPMAVNCSDILKAVQKDESVILDCYDSKFILSPNEDTSEKYTALLEQEIYKKENLKKIRKIKAQTSDGKKISLMSNIEIPEEINPVLSNRSEGIGLFRTEFLFLERSELPTEKEQTEIYKSIAEKIFPYPLVIRTVDIGGDKLSEILNVIPEENPNLGRRGIRLSFAKPDVFRTQIKAVLKANTKGNIKLMFPMISGVEEVIKAKKIVQECVKETGLPDLKIGAMIEVPSAALTSGQIARECDFLSIGTNDLIQYTLAADRNNELVTDCFEPFHPAILNLVKLTVDNAHNEGIEVAVCGELASNADFLPLLIGFGVDELSVSPGRILLIKSLILNGDSKEAEDIADECMKANTTKEIKKIIKKYRKL